MIKKASHIEIHNAMGDLERIEFYDVDKGEHIVDAIWDDRDEQTPEKRTEFREWAYHMLMQKDYLVDK